MLLRLLMCGLVVVGSACSNTVDPFEDTDRSLTIFGYLDTAVDTQFVRVIPFRTEIGRWEPGELDVDVTSHERESGVVHLWRDSLVTFDDGSVGHVFYSAFRPQPGLTYRFQVERDGREAAWAETTVPSLQGVDVGPPDPFAREDITQYVTWPDVDATPFRVEVWYRFAENEPQRPFKDIILTYDDIGQPVDDGWRVTVQLSRDAEEIRPDVGLVEPLLGVGMRLTKSDDQWRPPGGVFDEDVLVQPGAFSNVHGGYGYFGSVNQYTVEWVLTDVITRRLDFAVP